MEEVPLGNRLTNTVLNLEELELNLYRSTFVTKFKVGRAVFGGQVIGQALVAAGKTKPDGLEVHSFHCYFVRPGAADKPIVYHVDRLRDGTSFSTRTVTAMQKGHCIFTMQVSYHRSEVGCLSYQPKMPQVIHHSSLQTVQDIVSGFLQQGELTEIQKQNISVWMSRSMPMDMKLVDHMTYFRINAAPEPRQFYWAKAAGRLGDDQNLHICVAAYMSDWMLLRTSLLSTPKLRTGMMASLDHAMWFHAPFRADEWLLFDCETLSSGSNRSLITARVWRDDGVLAITVSQEGLIRAKL